MTSNLSNRKRVLFLTQFSMLLAIEAIVCFTPPLGSLPLFSIVATTAHIPVIIAAILLGVRAGAAMGLFAGIFSLIVWTLSPPTPPMAFVFSPFYNLGQFTGNGWSIVVCIVPRILIGVVAGVSFKLLNKALYKFDKNKILTYSLSGILGSLANTFFVLGGIYLFFGQDMNIVTQSLINVTVLAWIGATIMSNGVLEAILGAVAGYAVCRPIRKHLLKLEK